MTKVTRRKLIKAGTAAAATAMVSPALLDSAKTWAASSPWQPESGASLRLMRWSKWIDSEDVAFNMCGIMQCLCTSTCGAAE